MLNYEIYVQYLFADTITVDSVHKNICHIRTGMATFERCKRQLLRLQFPILRAFFWGRDVVPGDREVWISSFGCPSIESERNLSGHVLKT